MCIRDSLIPAGTGGALRRLKAIAAHQDTHAITKDDGTEHIEEGLPEGISEDF